MSGSFAIYVRWLFGWRDISSLHSADEPQEGRNNCPLLRSYLSVHVMLVSRNVFQVVSALQSILSLHIFILADQISCRSYIGSVNRMRSFAVCHSLNWYPFIHLSGAGGTVTLVSTVLPKSSKQCLRPGLKTRNPSTIGTASVRPLHERVPLTGPGGDSMRNHNS